MIGVGIAEDLVIATVTPCIDSKEYCTSDWSSCMQNNNFLADCCWSCHRRVEIDEDDESCYSEGMSDIMSATECAYAASQEGMAFIVVDSPSDEPVGCSRVESTQDVYQWNPAQRADDYELGDDAIRVCLQPLSPTAKANLRKYVPEYEDIRAGMTTYPYGDTKLRNLETAFTCADIEPSCELIPDVDACAAIADDEELRMLIVNQPYIPGGCFYYDGEMYWNSGGDIAFPPLFTTAYYSHICRNCMRTTCPLPVWLWFVLVALGLIICITSVCCCCFNFQTRTFRRPLRRGQPRLNPAAPRIQNTERGYNFDAIGKDQRVTYPDLDEGYPYTLNDSWDTPKVPMNLFNKPAT